MTVPAVAHLDGGTIVWANQVATDVNNLLASVAALTTIAGVPRYASTAARDAAIPTPAQGMLVYVVASDDYWWYTGAAWANFMDHPDLVSRYAPVQRMGSSLITGNQNGITAITDLTNFTATFSVIAGHTYEVSWLLQVIQNTAASNPLVKLFDSAVDLGFVASFTAAIAQTTMVSGSVQVSGLSAGAHTLKLRASVGAGTIDIVNNGVNGRFSVKDLGV